MPYKQQRKCDVIPAQEVDRRQQYLTNDTKHLKSNKNAKLSYAKKIEYDDTSDTEQYDREPQTLSGNPRRSRFSSHSNSRERPTSRQCDGEFSDDNDDSLAETNLNNIETANGNFSRIPFSGNGVNSIPQAIHNSRTDNELRDLARAMTILQLGTNSRVSCPGAKKYTRYRQITTKRHYMSSLSTAPNRKTTTKKHRMPVSKFVKDICWARILKKSLIQQKYEKYVC